MRKLLRAIYINIRKTLKFLNSDGKSVKYSISNKNREKIETELDLIIDNLPNFYE